jgi:hypothetical protein
MKKSRSGQAETGSNKRGKENNLTRTRSRNSVLVWDLPVSEALLLDEAIAD